VLGKLVQRPASLDKSLRRELMSCHRPSYDDFDVITATTMCALDFYEGSHHRTHLQNSQTLLLFCSLASVVVCRLSSYVTLPATNNATVVEKPGVFNFCLRMILPCPFLRYRRSSAIAVAPRDALCQLKSYQPLQKGSNRQS